MSIEWLTTKDRAAYTDIPGNWSDRRGGMNEGPALSFGGDMGVIIEGESAAAIAAYLRRIADRIDPPTDDD